MKRNIPSEVQQKILDDIWLRKLDGMTTREVATAYGITLTAARKFLYSVVNGVSVDERFIVAGSGVLVSDGALFTVGHQNLELNGAHTPDSLHHCVWFSC